MMKMRGDVTNGKEHKKMRERIGTKVKGKKLKKIKLKSLERNELLVNK